MKKIVFDIETKQAIPPGWPDNHVEKLEISLVGIYDYNANTYEGFLEEDFSRLWDILDKTDMLISYNGDHFDIPLLNEYYKKAGRGDLTKIRSLDLLKEIKNCYGRRMKLDQVAEGTFGIGKSNNGLDAVIWWEQGEIEKIRKYCLDDVRITKEVYEYALKNKKLLFKEGPFTKEIKMDVKHWEPISEIRTQSLF